MGDRANVLVKDDKSKVYLYTHWSGEELPTTLQIALKRKQRWDDSYYLTRIIFCAMVKGNEDGETGFGISSVVGDGDNRIPRWTSQKQTVSWKKNSMSFPTVH